MNCPIAQIPTESSFSTAMLAVFKTLLSTGWILRISSSCVVKWQQKLDSTTDNKNDVFINIMIG